MRLMMRVMMMMMMIVVIVCESEIVHRVIMYPFLFDRWWYEGGSEGTDVCLFGVFVLMLLALLLHTNRQNHIRRWSPAKVFR